MAGEKKQGAEAPCIQQQLINPDQTCVIRYALTRNGMVSQLKQGVHVDGGGRATNQISRSCTKSIAIPVTTAVLGIGQACQHVLLYLVRSSQHDGIVFCIGTISWTTSSKALIHTALAEQTDGYTQSGSFRNHANFSREVERTASQRTANTICIQVSSQGIENSWCPCIAGIEARWHSTQCALQLSVDRSCFGCGYKWCY